MQPLLIEFGCLQEAISCIRSGLPHACSCMGAASDCRHLAAAATVLWLQTGKAWPHQSMASVCTLAFHVSCNGCCQCQRSSSSYNATAASCLACASGVLAKRMILLPLTLKRHIQVSISGVVSLRVGLHQLLQGSYAGNWLVSPSTACRFSFGGSIMHALNTCVACARCLQDAHCLRLTFESEHTGQKQVTDLKAV